LLPHKSFLPEIEMKQVHRKLVMVGTLAVLVLAAFNARAEWPENAIKWIVPFSPGGANDLIARAAARGVAERLGKPIVIENKPGAGAVIGAQFVAKSKPDGYTFLIGAAGVVTNSFLYKKLEYADSDLVPVGMIAVAPSVIVASPSVPANNLQEFVQWAKAQGDKNVNWATAGSGSTPHFVAEMLKQAGVTNITIVPYKSGGDSVTAVLGDNVAATSEASIVVLPHIKAGKLKAIADTYEKRISAYPSLPTAIEQGFPTVNIGHWAGLFAPAGTPPAILERMSNELRAVVMSPQFREAMVPSGVEPVPYTLAEFTAFIGRERERLGRLAKSANMVAE
jgi:tripartite-type tricarboxylate transporter receptor subunit TctC